MLGSRLVAWRKGWVNGWKEAERSRRGSSTSLPTLMVAFTGRDQEWEEMKVRVRV